MRGPVGCVSGGSWYSLRPPLAGGQHLREGFLIITFPKAGAPIANGGPHEEALKTGRGRQSFPCQFLNGITKLVAATVALALGTADAEKEDR